MLATSETPGSPREFDAVLFDLDGVVTRTAELHAAAWAELFDGFLRRRAALGGEPLNTTLGWVLVQALREYAAGAWTPRPDDTAPERDPYQDEGGEA